jgi:hypothetical protein
MDINIKCNISLSKKLRALIGNNETTLTLVAGQLKDGKGIANIMMTLEDVNNNELNELMNKETSIMFTPIEVSESVPNGDSVTNIFSSSANIEHLPPQFAKKIGAIKPPQRQSETQYAIKSKVQIENEIPKTFEDVRRPEIKQYIMDLNGLNESIGRSIHKVYNVDIDSITDPRRKALAIEEREKAESIDQSVFVVNEKCKCLSLNDLGINLELNMPYNLSQISAKRLAASKDLKIMLGNGMIKFVHPESVNDYVEKVVREQESFGLEVYSGRKAASKALAEDGMDADVDSNSDFGIEDLDGPTEQEALYASTVGRNRGGFTQPPQSSSNNGVRMSSHGNASGMKTVPTRQEIPQRPSSNGEINSQKPTIKTIRRSGIEFK